MGAMDGSGGRRANLAGKQAFFHGPPQLVFKLTNDLPFVRPYFAVLARFPWETPEARRGGTVYK
jgi:hypothetical protein